ncbi:MAG: N-acetyl-gamma-glutamyl-phosphate reductase [Thermosediminibacterales bacterium]|nr:N-acetyl-gamma-glutamyl-phosphate reductase [Thermosediminibacterales bacterium]
MIRVSIIGATGYVGIELLRILIGHPEVSIAHLTSKTYKGQKIWHVYPCLKNFIDKTCEEMNFEKIVEDSDVVFTALPHGISMGIVHEFLDRGVKVIDMGADFRLKDVTEYETWYKIKHKSPDLIKEAVYGLPELYREEVKQARLVANPGCYPTSVILAAAPLLKAGIVKTDSIIVDSKSGTSGAGRSLRLDLHFSETSESFRAYSIAGSHRHTPEIEQELSLLAEEKLVISFTPHLVPMTRGILSTLYFKLNYQVSTEELTNMYIDFYKREPFVRILKDSLPQTKSVRGSNCCDIAVGVDKRTGRVTVVSAIDNLIKGAAGQAIQNMNLMFGLDEKTGLALPPLYP